MAKITKKLKKSLFFPPKSKRLARIITIKTPSAFRKSIKRLKKDGLTTKEKKVLVLARTRAKIMLKRKNLCVKERKQMREISRVRIPKIIKKKKKR